MKHLRQTTNNYFKLVLIIFSTFLWGFNPSDAIEIDDDTLLVNARRIQTGWLMMGTHLSYRDDEYAEAYVQELVDRGIRYIVTFHPPTDSIVEAMENHPDLVLFHQEYENYHETHWNFHWWLDWDVSWHKPLLDFVSQIENPKELVIHCAQGVDRTGNAVAFLLSVLYDIPLSQAYAAVVNNSYSDIDGLHQVLREFGFNEEFEEYSQFSYHGHGMKAYNSGFRDYIRENINIALEYGAEL